MKITTSVKIVLEKRSGDWYPIAIFNSTDAAAEFLIGSLAFPSYVTIDEKSGNCFIGHADGSVDEDSYRISYVSYIDTNNEN